MAETSPINITIDQDALREQVRAVITGELREMSVKLHHAADVLDPAFIEEAFNLEYERGFAAGQKAAAEPTPGGSTS